MLVKRYDVFTSSRKRGVDTAINPKGKWVKFADLKKMLFKEVRDDLPKFLEGVTGVVEADRDHQHHIYLVCKEQGWLHKSQNSGPMCCIGKFAGEEIWVVLSRVNIAGNEICFYHATSNVVNHEMVSEWIAHVMPVTAYNESRGHLNHSDSTNWTNVLTRREFGEAA